MGVNDQDLRPLPQGDVHRPLTQKGGVQLLAGAVVDVHPAVAEVQAALLALAGHLHDPFAVLSGLQVGQLLVLAAAVQLIGGLRRLRLLLSGPEVQHRLLPRRQQRGAAQQQAAPAGQSLLPAGQLPQLGLHQGGRQGGFLPQGGQPAVDAPQIRRQAHPPSRRQYQPQRRTPAQGTSHPVPHSITPYPA